MGRIKKGYKSINDLINILETKKNIMFGDIEVAREYLNKNSYYNFINSTKVKFIDFEQSSKSNKIYLKSTFKEWIDEFEKNIVLEKNLLSLCLRDEEAITNYIGIIVHENIKGDINPEFNDFVYKKLLNTKIVRLTHSKIKRKLPSCKKNILLNSWRYIHEIMLGEKIEIILLMSNKQLSKLNEIINFDCKDYSQLFAFKELRNDLAHNTPLNIYLTKVKTNISDDYFIRSKDRYKVINKLSNVRGSGLKGTKLNIDFCRKYSNLK